MQGSRNWNAYDNESWEVGGGKQVWCEPPARYITGAMIANKLDKGEKLAGASPVDYDIVNKTAKILKVFKVKEVTTSGSNTVISLHRLWDLPIVKVGETIMKCPTTMDGKGKAVLVTAVDYSTEGVQVITVPTANIDSVVAGDYMVQSAATETSASAEMYCKPWTFTLEDTIGARQNSVGIARGQKYLYKNLIPFLPPVIEANMKNVDWDWFGEVVTDGDYITDENIVNKL